MNHPDTRNLRRAARLLAGALVATAGALAMASAAAQARMQTVEQCLESGTDLVTLPAIAGGTLSASECRGCPSLRLRFDARTRYYISGELVSYARLREAAARGPLRLDVFYRPGDRTLTRLRLAAAATAQ
ncbi:MAG TPA: hypothetical protein VD791_11010 [Burkholderiales bacterium]|nr:hypothetical protein [Burkholderiales bacterium]